ncbi:hypothetical protein HDE_08720 [Halotydeus destructor]|nr:hypothetical protein HDE_08720 [Halotydeus destructor]
MGVPGVSLLLLATTVTWCSSIQNGDSKVDYLYLGDREEAFIKEVNLVAVPFQVDDTWYNSRRFPCPDKPDPKRPKDVTYGMVNYTEAHDRCYQRYKTQMKTAKYGGFAGCIVDSYNRITNRLRATYGKVMQISRDNQTVYFNPASLARREFSLYAPDLLMSRCGKYCYSVFSKFQTRSPFQFKGEKDYNSAVVGPAINVLRQFRHCWALSSLDDKYNWPEPRT